MPIHVWSTPNARNMGNKKKELETVEELEKYVLNVIMETLWDDHITGTLE